MAKYEQLASQIRHQIESGIWRAGEKMPSLRKQAEHAGMSLMTVMHAYQQLESQGWLVAHPRSGYTVAESIQMPSQPQNAAVETAEAVDINSFIFDVLQASRKPYMVNFAFAYPDPNLYPRHQVNKSLMHAARSMSVSNALDNLPPGNDTLRTMIAQRYAAKGISISPDEIVITAGALEALNLSLQAVTRPGDWVVVESPTFYGALQSLERLGLKALSVRTDARTGIDLDSLERAFQSHPVKACWLMTNHQNPLGFTLTEEKKRQLMILLNKYQVALIEDDVYSELYGGTEQPLPAKAFDVHGNVMLCSSFSKSLVAGFRIGWVAAGKRALDIQKLQLMSTLTTSVPIQLALVDYLSTRNYEHHLRQLRRTLDRRKKAMCKLLAQTLPTEVEIIAGDGSYFVWLRLPETSDTMAIYAQALAAQITLAPGKMFSPGTQFNHCLRLNTSFELDERHTQAILQLSRIIRLHCCRD
ncbi:PLP-dependent aminotransferase family protein [Photobacterium sp. GJ3]|uniref:aminotransferase-like domain-containing protein n=1 Tax=Photobacterium sp. GJ3 TaxID=2829502 RepID=UPI001B8D2F17|nr:PLP-dependent aminotransferase family protein [Photobacterium sp. GJ3]QUJ66416.1 PLP-dependent aminotransferase family protein [Photobacterium sp. GJ3]